MVRCIIDLEESVATSVGVIADVTVVDGPTSAVGSLEDRHGAVELLLCLDMVWFDLVRTEVVEVVALVLLHCLLLALGETAAVLFIEGHELGLELVAGRGGVLGTEDDRGECENLYIMLASYG